MQGMLGLVEPLLHLLHLLPCLLLQGICVDGPLCIPDGDSIPLRLPRSFHLFLRLPTCLVQSHLCTSELLLHCYPLTRTSKFLTCALLLVCGFLLCACFLARGFLLCACILARGLLLCALLLTRHMLLL